MLSLISLESWPWKETITLSISAIMGIFGFVFGTRFEKNNNDRNYMREIYKRIYSHLRELKRGIEQGMPKLWEDYPNSGDKIIPPIRALEEDGTISLLPKRFATDLLEVERTVLTSAGQWKEVIENDLPRHVESVFFHGVNETRDTQSGIRCRRILLSELLLMNEQQIDKFADEFNDDSIGLDLELMMTTNEHRSWPKRAYPDTIRKGSLGELIKEVHRVSLNNSEAHHIADALNGKKYEIRQLMQQAKQRIKDPCPLRFTLKQAVCDLFS